jgi:signal transduction histidine kinase
MSKHNVNKAKERLFLENIALNLRLAEIEDFLEDKSVVKAGVKMPNGNTAENIFAQPAAGHPYNVFIDGMNEGALTLSTERKILYCNNRFAQLLNSTAEDVIGSQLDIYIGAADIEKLDILLKSDHAHVNSIDISFIAANSDSPLILRLSVNYLPGTPDSKKIFLIAYDISGFIRALDQLRQAQSTSENRVTERTSKLIRANKELVTSRIATLSMMEDAVEAKNDLEATNRKLIEEIVERKRSELIQQVLFRISNAALITMDIEELLTIIQLELGKLLDTKNFFIAFYDEVTDTLSTLYVKDEKDTIESWPADGSLTGYVIKNRKKLLVNNEQIRELIRLGELELIGSLAQAWLGVPLEVDGRIIGALVVQSYDNKKAYSEKDMDMLEFVSHQIGISIQRKKAFQDLTIALSKAEESDRLKTAFLQNISHEIRTPMNAIMGFSDLLSDPDLEPEMQHTYTEIIQKSGNHLLAILEDIINISELEAGKEVLKPGKTNLNPMLRDMYEQFKLKAGKKNIELKLTTSLTDEQTCIITDETKLIQIISNLLNNSLKFTGQGNISFGYNLKNEKLEFFVEDTGVGIPDDKFQDIFDRFKQVEIVLSNENGGRGLGLGLSICKAYTELLGGTIWVKSAPGTGSTFYFSIPYTPLVMFNGNDRRKTEVELFSAKNQKTILVAENVKNNYLLVSEVFAGLHANIIWVSNGLEALQICRAVGKIDLVIMDINMAKMDGLEATKLIRVFMPDLPIIAQAYTASKKEQKEATASGFSEYLEKPLEISQIIALSNKYLDNYFNLYNIKHLAS